MNEQDLSTTYKKILEEATQTGLAKQVPLEPKINTSREVFCGKCGKAVKLNLLIEYEPATGEEVHCNYCPHCGQRVDWSFTEDFDV